MVLFGGAFFKLYSDYKHISYDDDFDYTVEQLEIVGNRFTDTLEIANNIDGFLDALNLVNDLTGIIISVVVPVSEAILELNNKVLSLYMRLFGDEGDDFYDSPLYGDDLRIPMNPFKKNFYRFWFGGERTPGSDYPIYPTRTS